MSASFSENTGFVGPIVGLTGGATASTTRFYASGNWGYDFARKQCVNNGHQLDRGISAYYRLSHFYLGGGLSYAKLVTSEYEKSSFHPRFGGGYEFFHGNLRIWADWITAGTDKINGVRGAYVDVDFRFRHDMRAQYFVNLASAYPSNFPNQPRQPFGGIGVALKYYPLSKKTKAP